MPPTRDSARHVPRTPLGCRTAVSRASAARPRDDGQTSTHEDDADDSVEPAEADEERADVWFLHARVREEDAQHGEDQARNRDQCPRDGADETLARGHVRLTRALTTSASSSQISCASSNV